MEAKKTFTPSEEQKTQYKAKIADLKEKRKQAKELSKNLDGLTAEQFAKVREVLPKMSGTGFLFCLHQMRNQGLDGLPGLDCKTFQGWKQYGFIVKKGEKSKIDGLTRVSAGGKEGEDSEGAMFPKVYHLFHSSQVQAIDGEKSEVRAEDARAEALPF